MYLILYQPEDNCSRISTVVFFGIVFITKDEVEALFLKLRLAVVTPSFLFVEEAIHLCYYKNLQSTFW